MNYTLAMNAKEIADAPHFFCELALKSIEHLFKKKWSSTPTRMCLLSYYHQLCDRTVGALGVYSPALARRHAAAGTLASPPDPAL
jgi:hypothetical protein